MSSVYCCYPFENEPDNVHFNFVLVLSGYAMAQCLHFWTFLMKSLLLCFSTRNKPNILFTYRDACLKEFIVSIQEKEKRKKKRHNFLWYIIKVDYANYYVNYTGISTFIIRENFYVFKFVVKWVVLSTSDTMTYGII